jgi:hypothetical protein
MQLRSSCVVQATAFSKDHPVVISKFILNAKEIEVDAVAVKVRSCFVLYVLLFPLMISSYNPCCEADSIDEWCAHIYLRKFIYWS